jgi:hypothetical protein
VDIKTAASYGALYAIGGKKARRLVRARLAFEKVMAEAAMKQAAEKVTAAIVWKLPHSVIYWAGIRIWANATTGPFSDIEAPGVKMDTAIKVWYDHLGGDHSFNRGLSRLWAYVVGYYELPLTAWEAVKRYRGHRMATEPTRTS